LSLWEDLERRIAAEFTEKPDSFLQQPTIKHVLHPDAQALAQRYWAELITDPFFLESVIGSLQDSPVGQPLPSKAFSLISPQSIQHAYYIMLIRERLGLYLPTGLNHITEIGGGYGNFCRLVKRLGFQGTYRMIDLPSMLGLQREFLGRNGALADVEFSQLGTRPEPVREHRSPSLLVATFSISEMPLPDRERAAGLYDTFDFLCFAHNATFDGVDNTLYFAALAKSLGSRFRCQHFKDRHRNCWFLLCSR
jgi:SAM-dependent methyltransferase